MTGGSRHHAVERARERYGIELSPADLAEITGKLRAGAGVIIAKLPDGKHRVAIDWGGVPMHIICLPISGKIITIVPRKPRKFAHRKRAR